MRAGSYNMAPVRGGRPERRVHKSGQATPCSSWTCSAISCRAARVACPAGDHLLRRSIARSACSTPLACPFSIHATASGQLRVVQCSRRASASNASPGTGVPPGRRFSPRLRVLAGRGRRLQGDQPGARLRGAVPRYVARAAVARGGVRRLYVGVLATDYCIRATVLAARREGFDVRVTADAIRAV